MEKQTDSRYKGINAYAGEMLGESNFLAAVTWYDPILFSHCTAKIRLFVCKFLQISFSFFSDCSFPIFCGLKIVGIKSTICSIPPAILRPYGGAGRRCGRAGRSVPIWGSVYVWCEILLLPCWGIMGGMKIGHLPSVPPVAVAVREKRLDMGMAEALARDAGLLDGVSDDCVDARMAELYREIREKSKQTDKLADGTEYWAAGIRFLVDLAGGMRHRAALDKNGLRWGVVQIMCNRSAAFKKMYVIAHHTQLDSFKPDVLDSAIDLAVNGDIVTVIDREGNIVAEDRRRNVKAMEMLLKASDERFRENDGSRNAGGGITYNITIGADLKLPEPGERPVIDIPVEEPVAVAVEAGEKKVEFAED